MTTNRFSYPLPQSASNVANIDSDAGATRYERERKNFDLLVKYGILLSGFFVVFGFVCFSFFVVCICVEHIDSRL